MDPLGGWRRGVVGRKVDLQWEDDMRHLRPLSCMVVQCGEQRMIVAIPASPGRSGTLWAIAYARIKRVEVRW